MKEKNIEALIEYGKSQGYDEEKLLQFVEEAEGKHAAEFAYRYFHPSEEERPARSPVIYVPKLTPEERKVKEQKINTIGGCVVTLIFFLIVGGCVYSCYPGQKEKKPEPEHDKATAFYMAQTFVERLLIYPASSSFPGVWDLDLDYEKQVKYLGDATYEVIWYVDDANIFGSKERKRYYLKLKYVGDKQWQRLNILIE